MITHDPLLAASVATRSDCQGLRLLVQNTSNTSIDVTLPNPYTGVELFDLQRKLIPHCSFFTWEHNDPHLILDPDESAVALLSLSLFWTNVSEDVIARCRLVARPPMGDEQIQYVEGLINLHLASDLDLAKQVRASQSKLPGSLPTITPKLLNVSDYVVVESGNNGKVPIRGKPIKMWCGGC
jgi:hypothetical protein